MRKICARRNFESDNSVSGDDWLDGQKLGSSSRPLAANSEVDNVDRYLSNLSELAQM
jgi:hypothetical protein